MAGNTHRQYGGQPGLVRRIEFGPAGPHANADVPGYPTGNEYIAPPSVNAYEERFRALSAPAVRLLYQRTAADYGEQFGPKDRLTPLVMSASAPIAFTATHPDIPVAMDASVQRVTLPYYFQDAAFVTRVTATLTALRLTADGLPEPGLFDGAVNPLDYLFVQFRRTGSNEVFQNQPLPLSAVAGNAQRGYFFDLIPLVKAGGSLAVDLTIMPPGFVGTTPPFVDRIGSVSLDFHTERWTPFGI